MIEQYIEAVSHELNAVFNLLIRLAPPLAVCFGLMVVAGALMFPLPENSTIRDLNVSVSGQAVMEPNQSGAYRDRDRLI